MTCSFHAPFPHRVGPVALHGRGPGWTPVWNGPSPRTSSKHRSHKPRCLDGGQNRRFGGGCSGSSDLHTVGGRHSWKGWLAGDLGTFGRSLMTSTWRSRPGRALHLVGWPMAPMPSRPPTPKSSPGTDNLADVFVQPTTIRRKPRHSWHPANLFESAVAMSMSASGMATPARSVSGRRPPNPDKGADDDTDASVRRLRRMWPASGSLFATAGKGGAFRLVRCQHPTAARPARVCKARAGADEEEELHSTTDPFWGTALAPTAVQNDI